MNIYQNLLDKIQGKWHCKKSINQISDQILNLEFTLLISENLISRLGNGDQFWPSLCSFESVGSLKDGYFYREDGCFMQVKSVSNDKMVIELSHKNSEGKLSFYLFNFNKDLK